MLFIKFLYLWRALLKITIWCSGFLFNGPEARHLGVLKWGRQSASALGATAAEHLTLGSHPGIAAQALNEGTKNTTPVLPFQHFSH